MSSQQVIDEHSIELQSKYKEKQRRRMSLPLIRLQHERPSRVRRNSSTSQSSTSSYTESSSDDEQGKHENPRQKQQKTTSGLSMCSFQYLMFIQQENQLNSLLKTLTVKLLVVK